MKMAPKSLLALGLSLFLASPGTAQSFVPAAPDVDAVAPTFSELSGFGVSLAVAGDQVLIGEGDTSLRPGAVYVFERAPDGSWRETAQLTAPTAAPSDGFGSALATDGDRLLVGAPASGGAYLFRRSGDAWEFVTEIGDPEEGSRFGAAVGLAGDHLVVGAPGTAGGDGAVHLFRESAGDWVSVTQIPAPEGMDGAAFGGSVALRAGELFVGAPLAESRSGTVLAYRAEGSTWVEAGTLAPRGDAQNALFGARLALFGEHVAVGSPSFGNAGATFLFSADETGSGWIERSRLQAFSGMQASAFGTAIAAGDDALWIGLPQADGRTGAVDRFFHDGDGWTGVERMTGSWTGPRDGFGSAIAVAGDLAAVAAGGTDSGAGSVIILERDGDGVWGEAETVESAPEALPSIVAESVMCENGEAAGFDCENIEILSFLPLPDLGAGRGIRLNDTWGWHDHETGREIVLVGRTDGTAFVDITDAANPVYLGEVLRTEGSPTAAWRDFKVFRDHAFIVADASGQHGMQVFDLRRLDEYEGEPITWEPDLIYDRIHSAHNIGLNEESGHVYIVGASQGGETCGGGLHMVDVNDPTNPQFAGCFADPQTGRTGTGYSHDVQCVTYRGPDERYFEREICMGSNETHLSVADVTDKSDPVAVSRVAYPNVGYVHQGWFDEEQHYFYMQDELALMGGLIDNTRTIIFDVSDLEDPIVVGEFFFDSRAISHNLYIVGDLMYEANYSSGLRILDISDRENPQEVGYIDTAPTHEQEPMFEGAWSTYPFFESGAISVSSIGEGLFIVRFHDPRPVS